MSLQKIFRTWVGVLALVALASYKWPGFGTVFLCSSVILLAVANRILSIQSKKLGLITGGSALILAFATCVGAGLSPLEIAVLTAFGAIAGYACAAMPVAFIESSERRKDDDHPSKSKVGGGGGEFDGGGASGDF
jgi:uncharacterized membrane protein YgcG